MPAQQNRNHRTWRDGRHGRLRRPNMVRDVGNICRPTKAHGRDEAASARHDSKRRSKIPLVTADNARTIQLGVDLCILNGIRHQLKAVHLRHLLGVDLTDCPRATADVKQHGVVRCLLQEGCEQRGEQQRRDRGVPAPATTLRPQSTTDLIQARELSDFPVQHFSAGHVGLEKGVGRDFKVQAKQPLCDDLMRGAPGKGG